MMPMLKTPAKLLYFLCGHGVEAAYYTASIPAKPLALPSSNVAGFSFPEGDRLP